MAATNIQFSVALHLMSILGFQPGTVRSSEMLAASVNTNPSFVRRSLSKLVKGGLIVATRGKHGSYCLAKLPEEITLLDIYRAAEAPATFAVHEYPTETRCPISSNIKPCTHSVLGEVQTIFEAALAEKTLAEVVADLHIRAS